CGQPEENSQTADIGESCHHDACRRRRIGPKFFENSGTTAPTTPLIRQLIVVARNTITPSITATGLFTIVAKTNIAIPPVTPVKRSEEHTSELQSCGHLVCRLLLEKKK